MHVRFVGTVAYTYIVSNHLSVYVLGIGLMLPQFSDDREVSTTQSFGASYHTDICFQIISDGLSEAMIYASKMGILHYMFTSAQC